MWNRKFEAQSPVALGLYLGSTFAAFRVPRASCLILHSCHGSGVRPFHQNYTRVARIHFGKLSVYQTASPVCRLSVRPSVGLSVCLSVVDCARFIFTQNGDALQKQTNTCTHTHTGIEACINISLACSPSETPKFCNIYKVAKNVAPQNQSQHMNAKTNPTALKPQLDPEPEPESTERPND